MLHYRNGFESEDQRQQRQQQSQLMSAGLQLTTQSIQSNLTEPLPAGMGVGLSLFLLRHLQPSLFGKPCWCVNRQQELSIKRGHHLRPPPSTTLTSAPQDFLRQTRLQGGPAGPIHLQPLTAMGTAFRPQAKGDRLNKEGRFDQGYASAAQWQRCSWVRHFFTGVM